jgi:hypothetical protein
MIVGVDWATLQLKAGDLVCLKHGIVTKPLREIVPACPDCLRSLTEAVQTKAGLVHREPVPARCPAGHPLTGGEYQIGHRGCLCVPGGGHTVWTCACGAETVWPPHTPVDSPPYLGPGRDDAWRAGQP